MTPAQILVILQALRMAQEMAMEWWKAFEQRGELTEEQRAAFAVEMEAAFKASHWRPSNLPPIP